MLLSIAWFWIRYKYLRYGPWLITYIQCSTCKWLSNLFADIKCKDQEEGT